MQPNRRVECLICGFTNEEPLTARSRRVDAVVREDAEKQQHIHNSASAINIVSLTHPGRLIPANSSDFLSHTHSGAKRPHEGRFSRCGWVVLCTGGTTQHGSVSALNRALIESFV